MSRQFDRAWATHLLGRARARLVAIAKDERMRRRTELLRLRYGEDLPIREIARRWSVDAAYLHHEHAIARREFKQALRTEVAMHQREQPRDLDRACRELLGLLR